MNKALQTFNSLYGEKVQVPEEEYQRDASYRLPCIIAYLCLLAGICITYFVNSHFHSGNKVMGIMLALSPFQFFGLLGGALALLPLARKLGPERTFCLGEDKWDTWLHRDVRLLLLIYPAIFVVNGLTLLFCKMLDIAVKPQYILEMALHESSPGFWIVFTISTVLLAPLSEELLLRLLLFRFLRSFCPLYATIATAIFFSLLHGNPQFFGGLFVMGYFLQHAFLQGGLGQSILLHCIYNAIILLSVVLKVLV